MRKPYGLFVGFSVLLAMGGLALIGLEGMLQVRETAVWGEMLSAVMERVRTGSESSPQLVNDANSTAPGVAQVSPASLVAERVNLPDVEGHFWLTFLYQENWQTDPETVRLHNMFLSDPRLVKMRKRCRVNSFSKMDPYMTERWQKYVGSNTPMVVLQSPDGRLCYKTSRGNIPSAANEMVREVQQSLDECFRRPCPQPDPSPTPGPQPNPAPVAPISPLPDTIGPAEEPRDAGDPLWLLPVLGIAGATGGVLLGRKRR